MARNGKAYQVIANSKALPYEWGYIWGATVSDGSIYAIQDKRYNNPYLHLALKVKEREFVRLFQECIQRLTGQEYTIGIKGDGCYKIVVTNQELISKLTKYSSLDTFHWEIPYDIFQDKDMARGFLNGYLDGDGYISSEGNKPRITWGSANLLGLTEAQLLLGKLGIYSKLGKNSNKGCFRLGVYPPFAVMKYYQDIGITSPSKRHKFQQIATLGVA